MICKVLTWCFLLIGWTCRLGCLRRTGSDGNDRRAYAGLDVSSTTDISALVLVFRDEEDHSIDVQTHFWIPGDNIRERSRRDRVCYEVWIDQGLINVTE